MNSEGESRQGRRLDLEEAKRGSGFAPARIRVVLASRQSHQANRKASRRSESLKDFLLGLSHEKKKK